jgi:hypothetical protein
MQRQQVFERSAADACLRGGRVPRNEGGSEVSEAVQLAGLRLLAGLRPPRGPC